jgi:hypothetical protein
MALLTMLEKWSRDWAGRGAIAALSSLPNSIPRD